MSAPILPNDLTPGERIRDIPRRQGYDPVAAAHNDLLRAARLIELGLFALDRKMDLLSAYALATEAAAQARAAAAQAEVELGRLRDAAAAAELSIDERTP